jgi:hypothetical protein
MLILKNCQRFYHQSKEKSDWSGCIDYASTRTIIGEVSKDELTELMGGDVAELIFLVIHRLS